VTSWRPESTSNPGEVVVEVRSSSGDALLGERRKQIATIDEDIASRAALA
jgi:hypothetical protein